MREIEEAFFPLALEERLAQYPTDAKELGIKLAKETMKHVRKRLAI